MRRWRRRAAWLGGAVAFVGLWLLASPSNATIAEQRARLPPAAECAGENVAGIWRSHQFVPRFSEWGIFTLTIRRVEGNPTQLTGRILSRGWDGGPNDAEPPPCSQQQGWDWTVEMDGRGSIQNETHIRFGGVGQWRLVNARCGRGPYGYNLDQFEGDIDPSILEFQSVNNDGGRYVNVPTVFRRISCAPTEYAESPSVQPRPPAFYPDLPGGWGCSR